MNLLVSLLSNSTFASYVAEQTPTLAELVRIFRTEEVLAQRFGADAVFAGSRLDPELEVDQLRAIVGVDDMALIQAELLVHQVRCSYAEGGSVPTSSAT